jgi:hypothetical protein
LKPGIVARRDFGKILRRKKKIGLGVPKFNLLIPTPSKRLENQKNVIE